MAPLPPSKRRNLSHPSSHPTKSLKRKRSQPTEEVTFDFSAREEYLTGFHKRKQARIKHAQELAARKAKEERDRERAALRQRRKEEVEAKLAQVEEWSRRNAAEVDEGR
jgi:ribosomal RNA-processing protein 17